MSTYAAILVLPSLFSLFTLSLPYYTLSSVKMGATSAVLTTAPQCLPVRQAYSKRAIIISVECVRVGKNFLEVSGMWTDGQDRWDAAQEGEEQLA